MKPLSQHIACILMVLTALGASAQSEVSLSLDSCKAMALRNQVAVRNALIEIDKAKETRRAALTKYFPTVTAMAGYFRSQNSLIDISSADNNGNMQITSSQTGESFQQQVNDIQQQVNELGLDINIQKLIDDFVEQYGQDIRLQMLDHGTFANMMAVQPIFAGGRIIHGNQLAKLGVSAAELQLAMTRNEVMLNTEQYYWRVVSLEEKMKTIGRVQQLLDTLERDAEAAYSAGVLGRTDLLKVRLKQNETKALRIQLEHGIEMATWALCQYVGLPYDKKAHYLFDELAEAPIVELSSGYERPEMQLLNTAVEAGRLKHAMALGEALPQVMVGATYGTNNLIGDAFKNNGMVFATVNVPISAWWETAHNARKERLEQQQAELKRADMAQLMQLQEAQAANAMAEAYLLIGVREQSVSDARENLIETGHYYQAGLASVSDFLEAQTLLQQAEDALVDQRISYIISRLTYAQLVGAEVDDGRILR